ncbi:hypothetical protein [Phenylobacterium soli]|uniref:Uncharacterized protein n=1 Tax=Phenylobacterium soli TaxID=2170551 RepID=A0A328ACC1_9CAUL|nr:hypothetical protein [Phenylobacterium soli]RAK51846.1 hypothetical protein DJ017_18700 [Phenylobacterium soli]
MLQGRTYSQPIVRALDADALAELSDEDAETGEDDGLEGNQQYRDLRFIGWDLVERVIEREKALFARFAAAPDLEAEAERFLEEIEAVWEPDEDFCGLDIGVIAATFALSALGAVTVSSCNAGGFGGRHAERFPLIIMYLPRHLAPEVLAIAEAADVGLDMVSGLVRLYGRSDYDLHRFAEVALARHLSRRAAALA